MALTNVPLWTLPIVRHHFKSHEFLGWVMVFLTDCMRYLLYINPQRTSIPKGHISK